MGSLRTYLYGAHIARMHRFVSKVRIYEGLRRQLRETIKRPMTGKKGSCRSSSSSSSSSSSASFLTQRLHLQIVHVLRLFVFNLSPSHACILQISFKDSRGCLVSMWKFYGLYRMYVRRIGIMYTRERWGLCAIVYRRGVEEVFSNYMKIAEWRNSNIYEMGEAAFARVYIYTYAGRLLLTVNIEGSRL